MTTPTPVPVTFFNPTTLSPRLITTFGASLKPAAPSGSPIGYFGTGLKYSIATILRGGGSITILTDQASYSFSVVEETIRGELLPLVHMTVQERSHGGEVPPPYSTPCGFTTSLGRNWEPWMVFRELWSNAKDEGGGLEPPVTFPEEFTLLIVSWEPLRQVLADKHSYILSSTPMEVVEGRLEVHPGPTSTVFYRGIAAGKLSAPARFTYNVLEHCSLTEDRTLPEYSAQGAIARGLLLATSPTILREVLTPQHATLESVLPYSSWHTVGPAWLSFAHNLALTKRNDLQGYAKEVVRHQRPESFLPASLTPTPTQATMLATAKSFCLAVGHPVTAPIHLSDGLGSGVLGAVLGQEIWLSTYVFTLGTKQVAGTLLEELLHLSTGEKDCTREFQNTLINLVCSLYENFTSTPL